MDNFLFLVKLCNFQLYGRSVSLSGTELKTVFELEKPSKKYATKNFKNFQELTSVISDQFL